MATAHSGNRFLFKSAAPVRFFFFLFFFSSFLFLFFNRNVQVLLFLLTLSENWRQILK